MANKITYENKVGIEPKTVHVNQWWDDDANEVKTQHNSLDDRVIVLEGKFPIAWSDIRSIGTLSQVTPASGDRFLIERAGAFRYVLYDDLGGGGGGVQDHSDLNGLEYENSGHTGFEKSLVFGVGFSRTPETPSAGKDQIDLNLATIDHDQLKNFEADEHFKQEDISITHDQVSDWDTEINKIKTVFELDLASGGSVQDRVNSSTPSQNGWSYSGDGLDLVINHGFDRRVMDVKVWVNDGGVEQQLRGTVSDNGLITPDSNTLRILSLATIAKPIKIYISFV